MSTSTLRTLLVHSSPLSLRGIERMLQKGAEFRVVGSALHGREALDLWTRLSPDLILCAPSLPLLDGVEFTREVMSRNPTPILALPQNPLDPLLAPMLEAGAIDFWTPPVNFAEEVAGAEALFAKLGRISRVPLISRRRTPDVLPPSRASLPGAEAKSEIKTEIKSETLPAFEGATKLRSPKIIAIGASTGGPPVLALILNALPRDFPFPIVVVQHISKGFASEMVEWLQGTTKIGVKLAHNGEIAQRGVAYFAPEDVHLEISLGGRLNFSVAEPFMGHRPSVNVLFYSVAKNYGHSAHALLLTGMGSDGALGLKAIQEAGGQTWAQTEQSCTVFGMPKEAIALGAARLVLTPTEMASRLASLRL